MRENVALLALLYPPTGRGLSPADLRRRFAEGELPSDVLQHPAEGTLLEVDVTEALDAAARELEVWEAEGIIVLTPFDDNYPTQMRSVFDYPLAIYARGEVRSDRLSAAIVGSREVSDTGLKFASELASLLSEDTITVVSGLARGVDGSAHRAALAAGGRTVAVLGNGLRHVYPSEHRALQDQIAETGLVISQFRPEARPNRQTFPQRNITMSAYSSITVIAEASEKSGTRIQANAAIKHARPLVLTSQVVRDTTWGATYAGGGYDVTVVNSATEAQQAVREILSRAQHAARWLTRA
ncbi:DNA-processing protein DprA [Microbacterium sp. SORGH_AS_0862]|uniref:DNA-processing protein DprA n=1 Tax=Microbacterium sp. SORGH_AS_0862 TaxID=3041789 RepID=UPI0027D850F7|nr:DNA-processing protein DprA [Microbacterium sp. SORGH_AS_0862]